MFRTPLIAALTVALLGGTALAQPANSPPTDLSGTARSAPDFDADDRYGPPVSDRQANPRAQATANEQRDRDMFCRRDAAARTGYTNPRDAARDEQARGSIGGTLGGAALGAIIGGADDTAQAKIEALKACGIAVAESPADLGSTMAKALGLA